MVIFAEKPVLKQKIVAFGSIIDVDRMSWKSLAKKMANLGKCVVHVGRWLRIILLHTVKNLVRRDRGNGNS